VSVDADLNRKIVERLKADYKLQDRGKWLRDGNCPRCGDRHKRTLFAAADKPRVVTCGRKDNCGWEEHVKDLYEDLFNDWSKRFPPTKESPTASADAYLLNQRGFDLLGLREAYTQEYYKDHARDIGSATVRFQLPGGSWWERIIDQPGRFDKKANFAPKSEYAGQAWLYPGTTFEQLAGAEEIWFDEGIFDTIALEQGAFRTERAKLPEPLAPNLPRGGRYAASLMSCYNYPAKFLEQLRAAVLAGPSPTRFPRLVFALDTGGAGATYTRKHVEQARDEGWTDVSAAQVRLDDDASAKLDWNDLHLRGDRLTPTHLADYRWHGEVLIAPSAEEKAFLLWDRKRWSSFSFVFRNRTWWAHFGKQRIQERIAEGWPDDPTMSIADIATKERAAARQICSVTEIANCAFRALYKQRDEATDETAYFFRIDFPTDRASSKGPFSASACSSGQEFAKRLLAIGTGAYWTGETGQLVRILQRQMAPIKDVEPIVFTGYSRDHGAWLLGDIAVKDGRIIKLNPDGYFDLGKQAVKLRTNERILDRIEYDPEKLDTSWLADFWTAYRERGMVVLAFWFGSLFAEQIRAEQASLGFVEMIGPPGTGKSSLLVFLWKLLGRVNYEGIDPAKATAAALARTLGKVANLPVVLMEGHRRDEAARSTKFEWDELLTAYNGRAVRSRGVANGGMETFDPLFRGAIVIEQNASVDASPALLERIMHVTFDKAGWSDTTRAAAKKIDGVPVGQVSGFILHALRAEAKILERYRAAFARHERDLKMLDGVINQRLELNHAQLLALLDALTIILPIGDDRYQKTRSFIHDMALERHRAIDSEHPHVTEFWERVEAIVADENSNPTHPLNHSRNWERGEWAISLVEYEQRASQRWRNHPTGAELRAQLKTSRLRRFVESKPVNSRATGAPRTVHCWVFQGPAPSTAN